MARRWPHELELNTLEINPDPDSGFRADPTEDHNLALLAHTDSKHRALLEDMNAKLNRLIDAEVGEDNGDFLPPEEEWCKQSVTSINP